MADGFVAVQGGADLFEDLGWLLEVHTFIEISFSFTIFHMTKKIFTALYRVTILDGNNLPLTWIRNVRPSCLGFR